VNWYFQCVYDGQMDARLVLCSEEYVNSLNTRVSVFPTLIQEIPFHYIKVGMWCVLSENRNFGSIFAAPQRKTQCNTTYITSSIA
jgi:hypothetical protein